MPTKLCIDCHQELPLEMYALRHTGKGTQFYNCRCRKCQNKFHYQYVKRRMLIDEEFKKMVKREIKKSTKKRYATDLEYRAATLAKTRENANQKKSTPEGRAHYNAVHNKAMRKYRTSEKGRNLKNAIARCGYFFQTHPELIDSLWKRANDRCEVCGIQLTRGKQHSYANHHVDEDRTNNKLENLMLLCSKCHLHTMHEKLGKYII